MKAFNISDFDAPTRFLKVILNREDIVAMSNNRLQLLPPPGAGLTYLIEKGLAAQNSDGSMFVGADGLLFEWFNSDLLSTLDTFMADAGFVLGSIAPTSFGATSGKLRENSGLFLAATAPLTGGSPDCYLEIQLEYRVVRKTWSVGRPA